MYGILKIKSEELLNIIKNHELQKEFYNREQEEIKEIEEIKRQEKTEAQKKLVTLSLKDRQAETKDNEYFETWLDDEAPLTIVGRTAEPQNIGSAA